MSDSRKRQVKRIVNAAMKSEKPAPATPSTAEIASGTHSETFSAPLLHVVRGPRIAEKRELVRLLQIRDDRRQVLEEVAHGSDDPHEEEQREQRDRDRGAEHGHGRRQAA